MASTVQSTNKSQTNDINNLSVPASALPNTYLTPCNGPAFPKPNSDELQRLAVSAGWNLQLLQSPVHRNRKCPILPSFVPRGIPQGFTVSSSQAMNETDSFFHTSPDSTTNQEKPRCPYNSKTQ